MDERTLRAGVNRFRRAGLGFAVASALLPFAAGAATYTVVNTNPGGTGSLYDAISIANSNCATDPAPVIQFAITGTGPFVINVPSPLPTLSCSTGPFDVTIDGYSQSGASSNTLPSGFDANINIVLDGAGSVSPAGLDHYPFWGYGSTLKVRGLEIRNFTYGGTGIGVRGALQLEGNRIAGNSIGVYDYSDSSIGGSVANRNVIGNNTLAGIEINYGGSPSIVQNFIGTLDGFTAAPNGDGIVAPGMYQATVSGNVISGNSNCGLWNNSGDYLTNITGNFIGTTATGTSGLGNSSGICIVGANTTVISNNVVSGNLVKGIDLVSPALVQIDGNRVGTDTSGNSPIANGIGAFVNFGTGLDISGNVFSGNGSDGLYLTSTGSTLISGNQFGMGQDGFTIVGNSGNGLVLENSSSNSVIGNTIAYNGLDGVLVQNGAIANKISISRIHSNGYKSISLDYFASPLPNDAGDLDGGPNSGQNYPIINSVIQAGGITTVNFTLDSIPSAVDGGSGTYDVEVFSNSFPGAPGGMMFHGVFPVVLSAGPVTQSVTIPALIDHVSLTATKTDTRDTSEFSPVVSRVVTPGVSVLPSALAFGNVVSGSSSTPMAVTLTSTGTGDWYIYGMGSPTCYSGPICSGSQFICSTDCTVNNPAAASGGTVANATAPGVYPPASSCTVTATFAPTVLGPQSATIEVCDNATGSPRTITLTGTGIVPPPVSLQLQPTLTNFGTVPVGSSAGPVYFTVYNPGNTPVTYLAAPTTSGPFTVTSTTCYGPLPPQQSCSVGVNFTPVAAGSATGALSMIPAGGATVFASLLGSGITAPELLLPAQLDFQHTIGTPPATQTVELRNTGLEPLAISSITLSGARFTMANDCPPTLQPGNGCLMNVGFSAVENGIFTGSISVVTNAPGGSRAIALRGIGQPRPVPILEVTPREIGFGSRALGSTSPGQTVTVRNVGGAPANFSSFVASPDYVIVSNGCGPSLASLASCTLSVAIRPVGFGARFGALGINSNAENSPNSVNLFGSGCRLSGLAIGRLGLTTGCGP